MLNEFLSQTNKAYDKTAVNDVQRVISDIGLTDMKASDVSDKLGKLVEIYNLIEVHCRYLTQCKGLKDSFYHRELSLLEDFIQYLSYLYDIPLPQSVGRPTGWYEVESLETVVIDDIKNPEAPYVSCEDNPTEETTHQKNSFDLELEDF